MTVTATYDTANARVAITANALGTATYATVERSTDGLIWTYVRGGTNVPVAAGAFVSTLYDYEFQTNVSNTYRVRGKTTGPMTLRATGAVAIDANLAGTSTIAPALPAGIVADEDLLLTTVSIRNSGAGTVNLPAGWTALLTMGNFSVIAKRYRSGDVAPTISFTGGVANATLIGKMFAFRLADIVPVTSASQLNGSVQNIDYPGIAVKTNGQIAMVGTWKQDDFTTTSAVPNMIQASTVSTTSGDDASMTFDYVVQTTAFSIPAGTLTLTGGGAAISRAFAMVLKQADFLNEQTGAVTPVLDVIWLKSTMRSFLNFKITVVDWSEPTRRSRGADLDVVNRSAPIATVDLHQSASFTLDIYAVDLATRNRLDFLAASGDVLFLHVPLGCEVPGGYFRVGDSSDRRPRPRATSRVFAFPLVGVASPGPDVVTADAYWSSVLATYGTVDALLAAFSTIDALMAFVGDPSDVIVP